MRSLTAPETIEARFWSKVEKTDGCWLWTAATRDNGSGQRYGMFNVTWREPVQAHRVAHMLTHGEIPEGLEIDHLCFNPGCVRPDHLEAVTHAENIRRAAARRTHCPQGHPLDGRRGDGYRYCLTCNRERVRRHKQRLKGSTQPVDRQARGGDASARPSLSPLNDATSLPSPAASSEPIEAELYAERAVHTPEYFADRQRFIDTFLTTGSVRR